MPITQVCSGNNTSGFHCYFSGRKTSDYGGDPGGDVQIEMEVGLSRSYSSTGTFHYIVELFDVEQNRIYQFEDVGNLYGGTMQYRVYYSVRNSFGDAIISPPRSWYIKVINTDMTISSATCYFSRYKEGFWNATDAVETKVAGGNPLDIPARAGGVSNDGVYLPTSLSISLW